MLNDLMSSLGITPNKEGFERLAGDLSKLVGKAPPWSWRYVRSVHVGDYRASKKMQAAVEAALARQDGASGELAASVAVTVYVSPEKANTIAGCYVMGTSKSCAGCGKLFLPNVPWRRFCGECRKVQISS